MVLENTYPRITCDFETELGERINIVVYPNIQTFHESTGSPSRGDWFVALANDQGARPLLSRGIHMVSLNNPGTVHDKQSMLVAAIHELTHFFIFKKSNRDWRDLPQWIHEGLACYEAVQFNTKSLNHMLEVALTKGIPSLELLSEHNSDVFCNAGGYAFSYTLIQFIAQKWNFKTLLRLIQNYDRFEETMGITIEEFESEWKAFITQRYLSLPFNSDVKKLVRCHAEGKKITN